MHLLYLFPPLGTFRCKLCSEQFRRTTGSALCNHKRQFVAVATRQQASCRHVRVPLTKFLWQADCFFSLSSIASTVHIPNEFLLWPYFANFMEFAVCIAFVMTWSRLIIQPCSFACTVFTFQPVGLFLCNFLWSFCSWRRPQCQSFSLLTITNKSLQGQEIFLLQNFQLGSGAHRSSYFWIPGLYCGL